MKKVLVVFEGTHFSSGAFNYAMHLNSLQPILLTGVFLPQVDYANLWSYGSGGSGPMFVPLMESVDSAIIQKNIETFSNLCMTNNIDFRVHKDVMDFALPELKRETRFADLLIVGSETFYANLGSYEQNEYLKDAISQAECPIIVVPEKSDIPGSIVIAYDGSKSSVHAIKQFAYLFPELAKLPALLVYVSREHDDFPDSGNIKELATRHYPDLTFLKLEMDPKKNFSTWLGEQEGAMLVAGAYGRSGFSQLFKSSFVSNVIDEHKLPVFIAHT
ncbi:MAG TPA: universal stress protein [Chitinophagaceae bacterium]